MKDAIIQAAVQWWVALILKIYANATAEQVDAFRTALEKEITFYCNSLGGFQLYVASHISAPLGNALVSAGLPPTRISTDAVMYVWPDKVTASEGDEPQTIIFKQEQL
jgi:hypothetical protein